MLSLSRRFEYDDVASKTDKVCRSESSTRRGNCHPRSPLIDASTAALARASASRRAAATAGIPVARSPTCAPAAANLASCSRAPDEDDAASCVCVFSPAVSFPPVATASVTAAASVAVGGSLVGGATPRLAKDTVGGVLDAASRDAGARERSPDLARVADRVFRAPPSSSSSSSSSGPPRRRLRESLGSSAASCVFRVVSTDAGAADLAAAAARTRRDASSSPALLLFAFCSRPPLLLSREEACARGLRRTPAAPRSRRSRG